MQPVNGCAGGPRQQDKSHFLLVLPMVMWSFSQKCVPVDSNACMGYMTKGPTFLILSSWMHCADIISKSALSARELQYTNMTREMPFWDSYYNSFLLSIFLFLAQAGGYLSSVKLLQQDKEPSNHFTVCYANVNFKPSQRVLHIWQSLWDNFIDYNKITNCVFIWHTAVLL